MVKRYDPVQAHRREGLYVDATDYDALACAYKQSMGRVRVAERLLSRALNQSARVHADFADDIKAWLADNASGAT